LRRRRILLLRFPQEIGGRSDRQDRADRLDSVGVPVLIDEGHHHFARRSSSSWVKNADAFRKISLAHFNSKFSRWSRFSSSRSIGGQAGPLAGIPLGLTHPDIRSRQRRTLTAATAHSGSTGLSRDRTAC
jgi:hypothetical protein